MLQKTKGIVIKTIKYGETSLIARIFTRELGIQSYIIKGARSSSAKNKGSLYQPPNILNLVAYYRSLKNLQQIKEAQHGHIFTSLPFDIRKCSIALFITELLSKTIVEEEKNAPLFEFIHHHLVLLDDQECLNPAFHLQFMLEFSRFLGFYPNCNTTTSQPIFDLRDGVFRADFPSHTDVIDFPYSHYIYRLLQSSSPEERVMIPAKDKAPLLEKLLLFYGYHIENFGHMNSPRILAEVLRE